MRSAADEWRSDLVHGVPRVLMEVEVPAQGGPDDRVAGKQCLVTQLMLRCAQPVAPHIHNESAVCFSNACRGRLAVRFCRWRGRAAPGDAWREPGGELQSFVPQNNPPVQTARRGADALSEECLAWEGA